MQAGKPLPTQLVTLLMQTPQLYARNTVRTSVSVAADEAGCTIVTVFCMLLVVAVYSYWDAVRSEPKQRGSCTSIVLLLQAPGTKVLHMLCRSGRHCCSVQASCASWCYSCCLALTSLECCDCLLAGQKDSKSSLCLTGCDYSCLC
jgi:hypothetical protein